MSSVENYILSSNRGPIFNYPNDMNNRYANIDFKAASIDDASDIINTTLNNISSLVPDLESIKNQVIELSDIWNNFMKLDDKGLECVFLDDLNKDMSCVSDSIDSGKTECNSLLDQFSSTINEINSYINILNENYNTYNKLSSDRNDYFKKMKDSSLTSEQREYYTNQYRDVCNKLSNYVELKNFDDLGRWVKKI